MYHIINEHIWIGGECEHELPVNVPTDDDGKLIPYFSIDIPTFDALRKILLDKLWLKSLKLLHKFRYVINCLQTYPSHENQNLLGILVS